MENRAKKLRLLESIINDGSRESLKSLRSEMYPIVLIFRPNGEVINLSPKQNPTLPEKYTNRNLSEKELDTMLAPYGKSVVFLLPENHR